VRILRNFFNKAEELHQPLQDQSRVNSAGGRFTRRKQDQLCRRARYPRRLLTRKPLDPLGSRFGPSDCGSLASLHRARNIIVPPLDPSSRCLPPLALPRRRSTLPRFHPPSPFASGSIWPIRRSRSGRSRRLNHASSRRRRGLDPRFLTAVADSVDDRASCFAAMAISGGRDGTGGLEGDDGGCLGWPPAERVVALASGRCPCSYMCSLQSGPTTTRPCSASTT
jgi:hypothetical protein